MYRTTALLALAGAVQVMARPMPSNMDVSNKKVVCFDFGDCLIFGGVLASCDRDGDKASLFGFLGTCGTPKTGLFGKRHGPDDDDDAAVVVVAVNATATPAAAAMNMKRHGPDGDDDEETTVVVAVNATAAPAKRQILADIIGGTAGAAADVVGGVAGLGADAIGSGIDAGKDVAEGLWDAGKDTLGSLLSIPAGILGFGSYGYDDKKAKRQFLADVIGGTAGAAADVVGGVAGLGADVIGSGIDAGKDVAEGLFDAGKDTLGSLLSIPADILGFGSYGYDDKEKRQIIADLVGSAADLGSDVIGGGIDAVTDTADAVLGGLGDVLSLPGDILGGFGGYGYDDDY